MKLIKWCSQHKWTYIFFILAFIIVPVLIEYIPLFFGQHLIKGDWLSFWGSYLGFLPAGLITYIVLEFQFKRQEGIDKKNFEEQLKKQKQEFLFEKRFEDLTWARNSAMSIWLASSEIIFVCESVEQSSEGMVFIYNEVTKHCNFIKNNHNELASWIEEQMTSESENYDFKKMDIIATEAGKRLSQIRHNMENKNVSEVLKSAKAFRKYYRELKNAITLEKTSIKNELID
ncbi:hypothetical protein [Leuconostoc mesenteroides]|uniref:hypothetical protein n=1 Tax=Leuconostoc mesenteroides TaxID=1245 RepID=UPI001238F252|nr:hypothetical protein [Leuconostoc mesenteroides]KAA8366297.1 hypothetical protein FE417_09325 [Leuconostoc mesenteroides]